MEPHILGESGIDRGHRFSKRVVARQAEADGKQVVMIDFTTHGQAEHKVTKHEVGRGKLSEEISAIDVSRRGDQIFVSATCKGKNVILTEGSCPTGDIHPIGVWVSTGGASCDLDVTLLTLRVDGASLPTDTLVPAPPLSWWTIAQWGFMILLAMSSVLVVRNV